MLENREADIGLTPRVFRSKSIQVSPIFDEPLYLVSNAKVSDYPDFVDVKTLKRANEIHFDWGLSFMDWHDRQLNPFETPLAITDTTQLIPKILQLPGSFSIIPLGLFKHYDDKDLKLSHITPAPPPRTCYLLRLKEPASNKLESILHFETEFRRMPKAWTTSFSAEQRPPAAAMQRPGACLYFLSQSGISLACSYRRT